MQNTKKIIIEMEKHTEREKKAKIQLTEILDRFDLSKWIFTNKVIIKSFSIPHSHPVLTLNTRHLDDDERAMSTFIHEQIHWFITFRWESAKLAIEELKMIYPSVPIGIPNGAIDEESTYLHFIVNYLELSALTEIFGKECALSIITRIDIYTEIYKTVIQDEEKLRNLFSKYDLLI